MNNSYQYSALSASGTTTIVAGAENLTLYTVTCPIALTGAVTFKDTAASPATYFVLPIGAIGTFRFDAKLPNGLQITLAADDTVITTYKTP